MTTSANDPATPPAYSRLDLPVFSLQENSSLPASEDWRARAVPWRDYKGGGNVGVSTNDGLLVVSARGDRGIETLQAMLGRVRTPSSYLVKTPDGLDCYFTLPAGYVLASSGAKINAEYGPNAGVSVHGQGSYVVGAGSVVDGKPYDVAQDEAVAEIPAEFLRLFCVEVNGRPAAGAVSEHDLRPAPRPKSPPELRYFHLPAGKKGPPLVRRFYDLAVPANDFDRGDNNVGVSTTGLLVLDVDNRKNGSDSLEILEMLNGPLPTTYTVATPNGRHYHFKPPHDVANSASKLGDGLDVRGHHGYVVGAGSIVNGVEYRALVDAPIAEAPDWLVDLCEKPRERELASDVPAEALDAPQNVDRATAYLKAADPAVQGAGGNDRTYRVAAAVMDFGLSRGRTVEALADWNERCSPPWSPEELERMVENAARYRTGAIGKSDPRNEFDVVEVPAAKNDNPTPPSGIERRPYKRSDVAPKPRQWLLDRTAIRGKLTLLVAPPGAGKSMVTITAAISIALGRDLLGIKVIEQANVWIYNNEDDQEELDRRIEGVLTAHSIHPTELEGRLFTNSGETLPLVIAKRAATGVKKSAMHGEMIDFIRDNKIGLTIVDPLSETHEGDENDNVQMRQVATFFREVAQKTNSAILLVHHTRKLPAGSSEGHAGNMDSGRGASSVSGVARVILTLMPASEKDAKRHGIPATQRHEYVRLDYAKGTFSASLGRPLWFRWESVPSLAWTAENNDRVGVLKPVELKTDDTEDDTIRRIVAEFCGGVPKPINDVVEFAVAHPLWPQGRSTDKVAARKTIEKVGARPETAELWRVDKGDGRRGSVTVVPVAESTGDDSTKSAAAEDKR